MMSAPLAFIFNQSHLHASARQGLDMLMMAVTLEQPCLAFFEGDAISQLLAPEISQIDPLKKMLMLPDLFEFEAFYVSAESLAQSPWSVANFRVPVNVISDAEKSNLLASCKHIIRFGN
ncbi:MAG: hypothetical protein LAT77_07990 [Aliidiomarina sp.]|uniref:DsrE family protein n=1 Tax=Aliidiomarina sp. TaxID=1872439 RepID=UPI0025BA933B|nr:DsrE family protein [Aliidiomarina sp.]MCH8501836.1 hypothetical protein [Aliidiomarina sp.]